MPRTKRTEGQLRIASDYLHYEYQMLIYLANGMVSNFFGESSVRNAILEAYVIHVRNLIYFLYAEKPKNDHIVASDFFRFPDEWVKIRPQKSDSLKKAEVRSNKEVAHLSYDRAKVTPETKPWHFIDLANEIIGVFNIYLENAPLELFGDRWSDFKKQREVKEGKTINE